MTREEFIEKYGEVEVKFDYYYKYSFTFTGTADDGLTIVSVVLGGNADNMYRSEVVNNQTFKVKNSYPYQGIAYKNGIEVDSFFDY